MNVGNVCTAGKFSYNTDNSDKTARSNGFADTISGISGRSSGIKIYFKKDDMLYSGANGTGLSYYLKYSEESTDDDPIVVAKGVDEKGNDFEETIRIKDINPRNATVVEMRALESHYHIDKGGGLSSFPLGSGNMGLRETADFIGIFDKTIKDMNMLGRYDRELFYRKNMNIYKSLFDNL